VTNQTAPLLSSSVLLGPSFLDVFTFFSFYFAFDTAHRVVWQEQKYNGNGISSFTSNARDLERSHARVTMRMPAHGTVARPTPALALDEADPTGRQEGDAYIMRWGHSAWRETTAQESPGGVVCVWGGSRANTKEVWKLGVGGACAASLNVEGGEGTRCVCISTTPPTTSSAFPQNHKMMRTTRRKKAGGGKSNTHPPNTL
jgi:hypothetical protein